MIDDYYYGGPASSWDHKYGDCRDPKEFAIRQFLLRVRQSKREGITDNSQAYAGEPMVFHCKWCGTICDILPEDYFFPPHKVCSQCEGLIQEGWLDAALRACGEYFE